MTCHIIVNIVVVRMQFIFMTSSDHFLHTINIYILSL